jgi:mycofactocin system FadH/OYE family oxidoreductase 2
MNADFSHLFSPLRVGPIIVRNRVLVTGHQPGLADDTLPGERYIAYQRARARGGAALQITGATSVHPSGWYYGSGFLANFDDRVIPGYQRLAEAVHAEGGRMLAQLAHAGALGHAALQGRPLWAPSPVPAELYREVPHEMTLSEIAEIVQAFGDAARRVREGGLDGVEIQAAYGLLINAFLSPYSNHRTDAYGGSLDNRLRFCLEVTDAVRSAVGPDLIVGIRIPGEEGVPNGLELAEMEEVAKRLEATGQLDFINVIVGTNLDRFQRVRHWPPTPAPHGLFVHLAAAIKQVVNLPVFTTGRVVDPRQAEQILAKGQADMVGMTRAHIADPDLVSKTRQGRLADIRPCIGANVCIAKVMDGLAVRCMHNPETGREAEWGPLTPATRPKQVIVVGGGPAGLEAARVAAQRGHQVTLYEAQPQLGGQLRLWALSPATRELHRIIEWQERQLQALGVTVHLNTPVTPNQLLAAHVEAIIIATGARPQQKPLPGAAESRIHILTPQQVLAGEVEPAQRAIVWDEAGGQPALSAAERLVQAGVNVEIITPGFAVGEDLNVTVRIPLYERLLAAGTIFTPNSQVVHLEDRQVVIRNLYSGAEARLGGVDLLVAWQGNRADDALWQAVGERLSEVYAVGDCVAPRLVESAMEEGAKVARGL